MDDKLVPWRKTKSEFIQGVINEFTAKEVYAEIDITNLQNRLLVEKVASISEAMQKELADKKNQLAEVRAVLRACEGLLIDYQKDEAKLRN